MIKTRNVCLRLGNKSLLEDVDLTLAASTVTVVMGPNGAGKTSLLRVLTGELAADKGQVLLHDKPIAAWRSEERARLMAVLPQASTLNFPFSVEEVIQLGRTPHSSGLKRDREIVHETLKQVDGTHLVDRLYTQLSGGEKQRIQLARVLAQIWEPVAEGERLLILDEPSASLDLAHQQLLLDTVKTLSRRGLAVVMVMHDFNLASGCADKLVMLGEGRVLANGTVSEVLQVDTVRRVFGVDVDIIKHPQSGLPVLIP